MKSFAPVAILTVVLASLVAGAVYLWSQDTRRGDEKPPYSVFRTDERGAAVLYRLYRQSGVHTGVWDRDLTQLQRPGVLLLVAPAQEDRILRGSVTIGTEGDLLPQEIQALDRWVSEGNVAVVMTREENDLYSALGLIMDEPKGISGTPAVPVQPGLLADRVGGIQTQTQFGFKFGRKKKSANEDEGEEGSAEPEPPIPAIPAAQWITLFSKKSDGREVPQVVAGARGKGLYVAVNDAFPAGNLGIAQGDDAQFMMNLARLLPAGGTLWIDEFHKRNVDRGFVTYLRDRSMSPAALYLLLLLALLFWRTGMRFGEPLPLVVERQRSSEEYVRAAASLYQNAGMPKDALTTIYADFRTRLIGALRMDGLANLEEVGRRYEARTGRPAMEARQILIETEAALARPRLTDAEALLFCRRLTHLDAELHRSAQLTAKSTRQGIPHGTG